VTVPWVSVDKRPQAAVFVLAAALGIGIGWPTLIVAPLSAALIMVSAAWAKQVRYLSPIGLVPLAVAFGAPWPVPALVTVFVTRLAGLHHLPVTARPSRRTVGLAVVVTVVAGLLITPMAIRITSAHPITIRSERPSFATIALIVILLSVVNAVAEELLWRGLVDRASSVSRMGIPLTLVVQAVSFGLAHNHGVPSGAVGMCSAAAFGMALTAVRRLGGIRLATVAHVVVDVVIFSIAAHNAVYFEAN
jgi:membrane protease YdiL (CAAX protease family)